MENAQEILEITKTWLLTDGFHIVKALAVLLVGMWIINKATRITALFFRQSNLEVGMASFLNSALKFFLRLLLVILVLPIIDINVTSIITTVGASLVTIGIAFKDTLSNFASGMLIILTKPIRVGDYIEFENVRGTVTKIEIMFTTLRSDEQKSIIIPNFRLISNNIIRNSDYDICKQIVDCYVCGKEIKLDVYKLVEFALVSDNRILQIPPPLIKCETESKDKVRVSVTLFCEKRYASDIGGIMAGSLGDSLKKYGLKVSLI